ncbi:hypothetical protein CFP65_1882 [Kitasatospora sp. MMS16-BH015]|uniref:acyl-CoA thioesterase/bile acid-CoA:amino acid N-acyltransferase family protein n=1 Tax=Kitasatospora sp. MMS16-BH015 TaxID=2018025 RepID=UPI000CA19F1E|nr:acyl-CoA thioesterase/bile acid-CoA:amino acid N-acyltransferase family protein [Kitasatospora sp. MMS16-BH015]AUG76753.1 hypothetical protein CFP65_1882 [Kitasatospora sp. MMS16-BH015]
MGSHIRGWAGVLAALALIGSAAGCSTRGSDRDAAIEVDAPTALMDTAVHLRVTGLTAGEQVTVHSQAKDQLGKEWHGEADLRADGHGRIELDTAEPAGGTYQAADGMGLFWSMTPQDGEGDPESTSFRPPIADPHGYRVTVTVSAHGQQLASRALTRQWIGVGVTHRELTLAADHVVGELYLPAPGTPRHPAVLVFGGSDGGNSKLFEAAMLASHGYPALSLGYFGLPGLPAKLEDVPLEYFAAAARLLAAQPGVDPAHVLAMGTSRGSEAALLLAERYPDLVHGAVVYAPSAQVVPGFPDEGTTAWTDGGKPVPQGDIPLDRVSGPVLALAGWEDQVWAAGAAAGQIDRTLSAAANRYPHQALVYPAAGHGVGTLPYLPTGTSLVHPVLDKLASLGGSRPANAAAKAAGWPKVLAMLAALDG